MSDGRCAYCGAFSGRDRYCSRRCAVGAEYDRLEERREAFERDDD